MNSSTDLIELEMGSTGRMASPHLPDCRPMCVDSMTLSGIRDYMTQMAPDAHTEGAILSVIDKWLRNPSGVEPLCSIRALLDSLRMLPRGEERLVRMNTFVRTLGQREVLAIILDMMQAAARRHGTGEQELARVSLSSIKHAVYGWCGQTKIMRSSAEPTGGVMMPETGVQELLGKTPTMAWSLSIHIWQANPKAKGFAAGKRAKPGIIVEPPHSHPFDFASMLVIGSMHQSIYAQRSSVADFTDAAADDTGRYGNTMLEHVHGVWPPHDGRETSRIATLEDRVPLKEGNSYYLPCNMIHDVETDTSVSSRRPAISLFLRSESVVKPHVYMARSMANFHEAHPDLEHSGYPLAEEDWHTKLELVAAYLRGVGSELNLDDVVKYDGDYAFFHSLS